MRLMKSLAAVAGTAVIALVAGGTSAQAASCPSEQSVLNYSGNDPAYQCAQHAWSGNKSIASWDTKSWTNSTAVGYSVKTHCNYRSDGDVTVTEAWASASYTATATNWDTGTRHFAAGVIFTTGPTDSGSYGSGCANSDGKMNNAIQKITQNVKVTGGFTNLATMNSTTITGTVSPSDATGYVVLMNGDKPIMIDASTPKTAPISAGTFTMKWTPLVPGTYNLSVAYPGDVTKCQAAAKSCGFTPGASATTKTNIVKGSTDSTNPVPDSVESEPASYTASLASVPAPDVSPASSEIPAAASNEAVGATARISSTGDTGVVLRQKSARMPAELSVNCPSSTVPLHAELFGANTGRSLKYSKTGVSLKSGVVAKGRKAVIQVLCREKNHSQEPSNRLGLGTAGADRLHTKARNGSLMGGPGNDRLTVRNRGGVAHGGLGVDRIIVKHKSGVATGGAGNDVIRSKASGRTLLVGGPGRDRIITSNDRTLVDSKDGQRDTVICNGTKSHVRGDTKDRLIGSCHRD